MYNRNGLFRYGVFVELKRVIRVRFKKLGDVLAE